MKIIAIIMATFVGCAFAGLPDPPEPVPTLPTLAPDSTPKLAECYVGTTIFNGTDLAVDEEATICSELMATCQTKVEVSPGTYRIYRQCQTSDACANNQVSNPQQCYSEEAIAKQEKVCHFCCDGDLCNDGSEIDIDLPDGQ